MDEHQVPFAKNIFYNGLENFPESYTLDLAIEFVSLLFVFVKDISELRFLYLFGFKVQELFSLGLEKL